MPSQDIKRDQLNELLLQALETEIGGIVVYERAISAAINDDLRKEWTSYLAQTRRHRDVLLGVFGELGLDSEAMTPGRQVVKHTGASLATAIELAMANDTPAAAQLVAGECVTLAETKDHLNWELIGYVAKQIGGDEAGVLMAAYEQVEDEEDEHVYHSKGWTRELWLQSLGLPAVLPPPEERRHVETAIEAARAEQSRGGML